MLCSNTRNVLLPLLLQLLRRLLLQLLRRLLRQLLRRLLRQLERGQIRPLRRTLSNGRVLRRIIETPLRHPSSVLLTIPVALRMQRR